METHVFLAVLAAALCHAGWNAMLKLKLAPLVAISLISVGCGIVTLPLVPFVGLPVPEAWPYVAASLAIHVLYYLALGEAYRAGDLGQVYPIARGSAPLITAFGAAVLLGESLGTQAIVGIAVLGLGILLLSLKGGRGVRLEPRPVGFALLTALMISAYTLVDGTGGRLGGDPTAYIVWLIFLDGVMMLAFGLWRWPATFLGDLRGNFAMMLIGGVLSTASYAIAIWAMSRAPIALVASLRETSVLFAAAIGIIVLREPVIASRLVAGALVLAGMVLVRLR